MLLTSGKLPTSGCVPDSIVRSNSDIYSLPNETAPRLDNSSSSDSVSSTHNNFEYSILLDNVQCITNKIQEIELILTPDNDVLCVNEHWLNENKFMIYNLPGYKLASIYYRLEKVMVVHLFT